MPWTEGLVRMGTGLGSDIAQEMFTIEEERERGLTLMK